MSRQRPAPNPVTAPMAGELHRPSATTSISTRSGPPAPDSGSRFTKVSCSTSATATRTTDTRARFTGSPHPPAEADGLGDGLAVSPGVTVTVTVGTGCGFLGAGGAGGSTENRGLWLGGTTTMPTTPSEVKFTNGRTRACAVSEHARDERPVMDRGRRHELLAGAQARVGVQHLQPHQARARTGLAGPGHPADLAAGGQRHAHHGRGVGGQQHRARLRVNGGHGADETLAVEHRVP